jgi:hypothetical protein
MFNTKKNRFFSSVFNFEKKTFLVEERERGCGWGRNQETQAKFLYI